MHFSSVYARMLVAMVSRAVGHTYMYFLTVTHLLSVHYHLLTLVIYW